MSKVQYPNVKVKLAGEDGNAFAIIGRVGAAIRKKHGHDAADAFQKAATSTHSYDEFLQFVMRTVRVS